MPESQPRRATKKKSTASRIRLKPHDPFDLIRLLARSQTDPRKAVAELVQNSLDAAAQRVEIAWFNEKGRRTLSVWDDGSGIFPELEREEALRKIAQTIGHSHKLGLSPGERRQQMVLGKYGIGLLGFWSVGEEMLIESRVGGGRTLCLRLQEDRAMGEVYPSRARRVDEEDTFTRVTIRGVHEASQSRIRPPRLQAFLASELRGQLLDREAVVTIRDRVARGRAKKRFTVQAQPYLGLPIDDLRELEVRGYDGARLELYLVSPEEDRAGRVALSCGGTVVLDDLALVDGDDAPRAPWSTGRLEGVIDFPDLDVAPSTRRGFVPGEPVEAFLAALVGLETELAERLRAEERRRAEVRNETLAKEIRRAFRSVVNRLPEYELFEVKDGPAAGSGAQGRGAQAGAPGEVLAASPGAQGTEPGSSVEAAATDDPGAEPGPADDRLFPPGPLANLSLKPRTLRLAPGARRSLRVLALDADGRRVTGDVAFQWSLEGPGELTSDGARAEYVAPDAAPGGAGPHARVRVVAADGDALAEAEAPVRIVEPLLGPEGGIPEPEPVDAPAEPWRSRMQGGVWQYNEGHRDYRAVAATEAARLRYLIHLFAKEVVLRNFGDARDAAVLERMVEVLTYVGSGKRGAP